MLVAVESKGSCINTVLVVVYGYILHMLVPLALRSHQQASRSCTTLKLREELLASSQCSDYRFQLEALRPSKLRSLFTTVTAYDGDGGMVRRRGGPGKMKDLGCAQQSFNFVRVSLEVRS